MPKFARLSRVRTLLKEVDRVDEVSEPPGGLVGNKVRESGLGGRIRYIGGDLPQDGLQRRAMVKLVQLAGARYGLQDDIDVYLAAAGCATPAGLDTAQLRTLATWVGQAMDRLATAADCPDTPPAC